MNHFKGREEHRLGTHLSNAIRQLTVYLDMQGLFAVCTFGCDETRYILFTQSPLHEGHRYCVNCSGSVYVFPVSERYLMGCLVDRHGICPRDCPLIVSE